MRVCEGAAASFVFVLSHVCTCMYVSCEHAYVGVYIVHWWIYDLAPELILKRLRNPIGMRRRMQV